MDVRWAQRFGNFAKAFKLLRGALEEREIDDYDDLQKEGVIQRFEYTFELFWKTVRDYLQNEEVDIGVVSAKNVIKAAARSNLLELMDVDGEILLDMLETRNMMSHTYDMDKFTLALNEIKGSFLGELGKAYEYLWTRSLALE